jgi:predicted ATPase
MSSRRSSLEEHGFIRSVRLDRDSVASFEHFPFNIPAVRRLDVLALDPKVTLFVGENGSGKSTLIEAIAVACSFNPEGGTRNFRFSTRSSESELHTHLRIVRGARRLRDGFFLRSESTFNLSTQIEILDREAADIKGLTAPPIIHSYGRSSLHEQSHGESLLALVTHRFGGHGLYLLDEPEAALSPSRQLSLLQIMHRLVEEKGSQFIVATHSPILMAYPGARLYQLGHGAIEEIAYEETEHYRLTRDFLANPASFFRHLFAIGAHEGTVSVVHLRR